MVPYLVSQLFSNSGLSPQPVGLSLRPLRQTPQRVSRGRRVLLLLTLVAMGGWAIACQPQAPRVTASSQLEVDSTAEVTPTVSTFTHREFDFTFTYPYSYIAEPIDLGTENHDPDLKASIDLWSDRNYAAIRANVYEGSEYPANVTVSVYEKAETIGLEEWIRQDFRFLAVMDVTSLQVAGQDAIRFDSTGLYEYDNIAVPSPDGKSVVIINLARLMEDNEAYKPAFETILSTFEFQAAPEQASSEPSADS
ncbi:MAG: hypothetical protein KME20_14655 [Kaiparowitsia implicata GSE-PSE-MK54-09C]|jgi:hypothetical protein|nr:hypothetical protein [Kaiparowitsia implicata GSE-PSE-MK54-09C]